MKVFLRNLTIGVLGSLCTTFLTSYVFQFIKFGFRKALSSKEFLNIVFSYSFLVYWISLLILLFFIRWFIRNRINNLQTPYPLIMSIGSNYDLKFEGQAYGFKWRIWADIKHKHPLTEEILDIKVGRVEGPYCLNDYREMKVYRTFFGRYRYKCPKCGYKRILLKNTWSLEYDIKDDIEAKYRNKTNIVS